MNSTNNNKLLMHTPIHPFLYDSTYLCVTFVSVKDSNTNKIHLSPHVTQPPNNKAGKYSTCASLIVISVHLQKSMPAEISVVCTRICFTSFK